jgi:hypothetical protein
MSYQKDRECDGRIIRLQLGASVAHSATLSWSVAKDGYVSFADRRAATEENRLDGASSSLPGHAQPKETPPKRGRIGLLFIRINRSRLRLRR